MLVVALLSLLILHINGQRSYVSTEVGREARLICSWKGLDDPNIIQNVRWFKKRRLQPTNRIKFERNGLNFTMIIKDVRETDDGTYTCSPQTVVKDTKIDDGTVRLIVSKPTIPDSPTPSTLRLRSGASAVLQCNFKRAVEIYNLKVFWTRNKLRFRPAGENAFKISNKYETRMHPSTRDGINFLNITNVEPGIEGNYSCNYRYPDGRKFTMTYIIKVYTPQERMYNVTWSENISRGMLRCNISGIPGVVSFHWEKDGYHLTKSDKYNITTAGDLEYIMVNDVEVEDAGVYRCVAERSSYDIGLKFNVKIEKDMKDYYYSEWTPFSVCDSQNRKHRFRVCKNKECVSKYGNIYEYNVESCQ